MMVAKKTKAKDLPHTCPTATVIDKETVRNARVVTVDKCKYRGATIRGTFLVPGRPIVTHLKDKRYIQVKLKWFGWATKTGTSRITILSKPRFEEKFSGKVVSNLGNKK